MGREEIRKERIEGRRSKEGCGNEGGGCEGSGNGYDVMGGVRNEEGGV